MNSHVSVVYGQKNHVRNTFLKLLQQMRDSSNDQNGTIRYTGIGPDVASVP